MHLKTSITCMRISNRSYKVLTLEPCCQSTLWCVHIHNQACSMYIVSSEAQKLCDRSPFATDAKYSVHAALLAPHLHWMLRSFISCPVKQFSSTSHFLHRRHTAVSQKLAPMICFRDNTMCSVDAYELISRTKLAPHARYLLCERILDFISQNRGNRSRLLMSKHFTYCVLLNREGITGNAPFR